MKLFPTCQEEFADKFSSCPVAGMPLTRPSQSGKVGELFTCERACEVATLVNRDFGVVKARLHPAREQLRDVLQPYLNTNREIVIWERANIREVVRKFNQRSYAQVALELTSGNAHFQPKR